MPCVDAILRKKGSQVLSVSPQATVLDAAILMNDHRVGGLVAIDHGRLAGIFTERDVLRRVVADRRDPSQTRVAEVMTSPVAYCHRDTSLDEARRVFMNRRIRHLPVLDETGQLLGMISIGDLNAWDLDGQEITIQHLHEYIYGRT